jgi:NADH:ubiquinone oxidoreductase subunit 5 (subunit L)/multisubunit Na+/H+ antiporter MnhA subunit
MDNLFLKPLFLFDKLNTFIIWAVAAFSVLAVAYSLIFMRGRVRPFAYYSYLALTILSTIGVLAANNLIILFLFWGFLGVLLYLLIAQGSGMSHLAAKKTLIIVGGADVCMLCGIGILYYLTGTFQMDQIRIPLGTHNGFLALCAYICFAIACFAKAGVMPFHSWIPDAAMSAPVPVTAYLPASIDKLLGIYLLVRLSFDMFLMSGGVQVMLMVVGAVTIVLAGMMALVQNDAKRLLGYSAVSQVGYMVVGIGTGNPIGIAGSLFHMINHAVYETCLFFDAGNVEHRAHSTDFNKTGGLAKVMPLTYLTCIVAGLSVSGIPPLNGFVSKWFIYQGIIASFSGFQSVVPQGVSVIVLLAAMFGSGLSLASFLKLLHGLFLGPRLASARGQTIKEVHWLMWGPCLLLAVTCIVFGIGAFSIPLRLFIFPVVASYESLSLAQLPGNWYPVLAGIFILVGLCIGIIIFFQGKYRRSLRHDAAFIGAEVDGMRAFKEENMVSGADFFNTIQEAPFLKRLYASAAAGFFDIYEQGKEIFKVAKVFQYLHNGILPTYLVWMLLGMVGLFLVLLR